MDPKMKNNNPTIKFSLHNKKFNEILTSEAAVHREPSLVLW